MRLFVIDEMGLYQAAVSWAQARLSSTTASAAVYATAVVVIVSLISICIAGHGRAALRSAPPDPVSADQRARSDA